MHDNIYDNIFEMKEEKGNERPGLGGVGGGHYGESGDMRPMGLRWYLPSNVTKYEGGKKA